MSGPVDVDIDQLLAGQIKVGRTAQRTYGDHRFTIHELPAAVLWDHGAENQKILERKVDGESVSEGESQRLAAGFVVRLLKGPNYKPVPEELESAIDALVSNVADGLISKLYLDGLNWNGQELQEDALKKD